MTISFASTVFFSSASVICRAKPSWVVLLSIFCNLVKILSPFWQTKCKKITLLTSNFQCRVSDKALGTTRRFLANQNQDCILSVICNLHFNLWDGQMRHILWKCKRDVKNDLIRNQWRWFVCVERPLFRLEFLTRVLLFYSITGTENPVFTHKLHNEGKVTWEHLMCCKVPIPVYFIMVSNESYPSVSFTWGFSVFKYQRIDQILMFSCIDIDECASLEINVCDDNALCMNTIGSYSCSCKDGYEKRGGICQGKYCCCVVHCIPLVKVTQHCFICVPCNALPRSISHVPFKNDRMYLPVINLE